MEMDFPANHVWLPEGSLLRKVWFRTSISPVDKGRSCTNENAGAVAKPVHDILWKPNFSTDVVFFNTPNLCLPENVETMVVSPFMIPKPMGFCLSQRNPMFSASHDVLVFAQGLGPEDQAQTVHGGGAEAVPREPAATRSAECARGGAQGELGARGSWEYHGNIIYHIYIISYIYNIILSYYIYYIILYYIIYIYYIYIY